MVIRVRLPANSRTVTPESGTAVPIPPVSVSEGVVLGSVCASIGIVSLMLLSIKLLWLKSCQLNNSLYKWLKIRGLKVVLV